MKYQIILSDEISKELDTDYGVLNAYWNTSKRLIKQKNKVECLKFLQDFGSQFGLFKMQEAKGGMIDAKIF